jgi:hypothetical protein
MQTEKGDVYDFDAALDAMAEGMERVDAHASPEWKAAMQELVVEVARRHKQFTADDVFELAAERGVRSTHDRRAFGPVMMRAKRAGVCIKANAVAVPSRRRSLHASPITVWDSLIWEQAA